MDIVDLFEAAAAANPDRVAVDCDGQNLRYDALQQRVIATHQQLLANGVEAGDRVGIFLPPSIDFVVAVLGVLRSGASYVPLDPSYPAARLEHMVVTADIRMLVHDTLAPAPFDVPNLCLQEDAPVELLPRQNPAELAYTLFTSGSTGKPKGVEIPHTALLNHTRWMQRRFPLSVDDVVVQRTALSFDASVWELFAPLVVGAKLLIVPEHERRSPGELLSRMQAGGATVLQLVPSLLDVLVEAGLASCTQLRRLFVGGEVFSPQLLQRAHRATPHTELVNLYGPTECTVDATFWVCEPDAERVPIGVPVDGVEAHVVDARGKLAQRGELLLSGVQLARGYVKDPEGTAAKFMHHPELDRRVYRTGDIVERDAEGRLHYVGREDTLVKWRGNRVELGEIEAVLRAHEGVRDCAVVVSAKARQLIAYLVGTSEHDVAELRSSIGSRLPQYMLPQAFVFIDALPVLPNGKTDRSDLARREPPASAKPVRNIATETGDWITNAWDELLKVQGLLTSEANFVELGGDSLLLMQFLTQVEERFGVVLEPDIVMLEELAVVAKTIDEQRLQTQQVSDERGAPNRAQRWRDRRRKRQSAKHY